MGATELATTWRDPDFDAKLPALYYVGVPEISTPRWSTIVAAKRGTEPSADFPATIQERVDFADLVCA